MKFYKNKYLFFIFENILKISKLFLPNIEIDKKIDKIVYLRMMSRYEGRGITYGKNTIFYTVKFSSSSKGDQFIIGNNVCLTGCTLLGHDASPAMFIEDLQVYKDVYRKGSRRSYRRPIIIGDNVFVGVGAIILPGINVGSNSIVAAGSVVTRDVQEGIIVGGNPAKNIGIVTDLMNKYKDILKKNPELF